MNLEVFMFFLMGLFCLTFGSLGGGVIYACRVVYGKVCSEAYFAYNSIRNLVTNSSAINDCPDWSDLESDDDNTERPYLDHEVKNQNLCPDKNNVDYVTKKSN